MNVLDYLIIIPLIYAGYKGFRHGLIIELFTFLAFFVGAYAGIHFSDLVAGKLKVNFHWNSVYLPVISFTIIFLAVGAMVYFAGKAIEKVVKVVNLSPLNKVAGIFFAVLKMIYILSLLVVILEGYDPHKRLINKETRDASVLYEPVKNMATYTIPGVGSSQLILENAWKSQVDSTGLSVEQLLRAKEIADSLGIDANDAKSITEVHEKYAR